MRTVSEGIELPQEASRAIAQLVQTSKILPHAWATLMSKLQLIVVG